MKTWNLTQHTETENGNDVTLDYGQIKMDTELDRKSVV